MEGCSITTPQFPHMRERGTQSGGNGIVVVILEVVVVGVVLGEVLHRGVHGCLCRWGETTRV